MRYNLIRKAWDRDGTGGPVQEERKEEMGRKRWVDPVPTKQKIKQGEGARVGEDVGRGQYWERNHGLTIQAGTAEKRHLNANARQ